MAYQKLVGQGTRAMFICPSDVVDIPNPSDQIIWDRLGIVTEYYLTAVSASATVLTLALGQITWDDMDVKGGEIVYFYDNVTPTVFLGAAKIISGPLDPVKLEVRVEYDTHFTPVLDATAYNIKVFREPTDFPMVVLPKSAGSVSTTFITAGGDTLDMTGNSPVGIYMPSVYFDPSSMQLGSSMGFPVQIRRMLNTTRDKTGALTNVQSNVGWETYYVGNW